MGGGIRLGIAGHMLFLGHVSEPGIPTLETQGDDGSAGYCAVRAAGTPTTGGIAGAEGRGIADAILLRQISLGRV